MLYEPNEIEQNAGESSELIGYIFDAGGICIHAEMYKDVVDLFDRLRQLYKAISF